MGSYVLPMLTFVLAAAAVLWGKLLGSVGSTTHPSDVQALRDLLQAVDPTSIPAGSCLSSWDFSVDPCDSAFGQQFTCGLRCDLNDSGGLARVTELALDPAGYSGLLPLSPGTLPFLGNLDVADNSFHGPLPWAISNLTRLSRLSLSHNFFSGRIPPSFADSLSSLRDLYLDNNLLEGPIPPVLGSGDGLSGLVRLELQGNRLSGEFPDLSRLKNLAYFDASDNLLSGGVVPSRFPPSIVQISMRDNGLEGELSEGIGYLHLLQVMDLSHNKLSGSLPAALFEHPALEQLTLSYNGFSAVEIPASSGRGSELIALDLGHNWLEGLVPPFMGLMPRLSALSLESNRFTGVIPAQIAVKAVGGDGVVPFARLVLSDNYLFGPIPGPFLGMRPGSAMVSLADNCLMSCPDSFFFCQGGQQKSLADCNNFSPVIP